MLKLIKRCNSKQRRRRRNTLGAEMLEPRRLLAGDFGILATDYLASEEVAPGEEVVMSQVDAMSSRGVYLDKLSFDAQPNTSFGEIDTFELRADLRDANGRFGRQDGVYETVIDSNVEPDGDTVTFDTGWYGYLTGWRRLGLDMQIIADVSDDASTQQIGLDEPKGEFKSWRCRWWRRGSCRVDVLTFGPDNPTHNVVAEESTLVFTEVATPATDVVVRNQKDVALMRFETTADNDDIIINTTSFEVQVGNGNDFTNYSWWWDSDDNGTVDQVLEDGVTAVNGLIKFDNPTEIINQDGQTIAFEIRADAASTFTGNQFQLGLPEDPVEAEEFLTGQAVDEIIVNRGSSTTFTLADQGDLFITTSDTPVREQFLLGGELSEVVMRMNFRAQNEATRVSYLGLNVESGNGNSIDRIELYNEGAVNPFGALTRAVGASRGDDFGGNFYFGSFANPEGESENILVRVRIKPDTQGGTSGEPIQLSLGKVEAEGLTSSRTLLNNDGDSAAEGEVFKGTDVPGADQPVVAPEHIVVMSQIVSVVNSNPDADGSLVPLGANREVGVFTYTAAANSNSSGGTNDSVIDNASFTFVASGVEFDPNGFSLYNRQDASVRATDYSLVQVSQFTWQVTFNNLSSSFVNTEIDQGETLDLVFASTNFSATDDAILQVSSRLDEGSFDWLDEDGNSSTPLSGLRLDVDTVRSTTYRNG